MILAAPLVIPFAEAVGISIATLGMAKGADMVNDYIQENPEQSAMILKTLVPNLGIGEIFMNKEKISLEDLDEMTDEEAQDLTKEEKAELMKQAGKSGGGKSKRQTMIDLSEKLGLSGEGREQQDIEYEVDERYDEGGVEDAPKPKFDYKKFFKKRYADGGAIGIEVLFEEKKPRKNFFMGGPALEGQALNIYNSMNSYGFTDQQIADALQGQGLYIPAGGGEGGSEQVSGIINEQIQTGGDGRMQGLNQTFTKDLSQDPRFNYLEPTAQANKYRFDRSVEPRDGLMGLYDKTKNFFAENKFFQPKVRGTLGTRMANQPKLPIPSFASFLSNYTSPFNMKSKSYNPLLESQLNFAETQEGIVGRDPNSGLLKYGPESVLSGKNVVSMFGTNDYEKMLQDYISKMNANKRISTERKTARLAQAEAELKALQAKTEADRAAQYGQTDYGRGSDGQRSYSNMGTQGFGVGATTGGPVSNRTGRGRQDYSKGGLATMFVEKR